MESDNRIMEVAAQMQSAIVERINLDIEKQVSPKIELLNQSQLQTSDLLAKQAEATKLEYEKNRRVTTLNYICWLFSTRLLIVFINHRQNADTISNCADLLKELIEFGNTYFDRVFKAETIEQLSDINKEIGLKWREIRERIDKLD